MKKRNLMLGSAIMLAVLLVVGGTLAWFTAETQPINNEFTAGTVEIELIDVFDGAPNVNPGDCYTKEVAVKNTGTKRAMVRVKESTAITGYTGDGPTDISIVKFELNEDWVYDAATNYFYYTKVLEPGATTPSILKDNQICFDGPKMGNDYQGSVFTITVEADAIQATNGAPTAEGWIYDPLKPAVPEV